jgi:hypothetical protein
MRKESKYPDLSESAVANLCAPPPDEKRIIEALKKTWDYIGDEVINLCGDPVSRDVVIETTVDRIAEFDEDASRVLMKMSYDEIQEIAKKAFRCESYGF